MVSVSEIMTGMVCIVDYKKGKRLFDIALSLWLIGVFALPMIVIAVVIEASSKGKAIFWSDRIGIDNRLFRMPKFRTMRIDTPQVATHLMVNPATYLTPIGGFLRKTSLDELPQLFCVLKGNMSFVGPRPALFNQADLIALRTVKGVHEILPGITGWAQINGRDELPIPVKVEHDAFYAHHRSFKLDMEIILYTIFKVVFKEGIDH